MIVVKLMAGLGNQMFQYATARRLADANKVELKLDISSYENINEKDTPRKYELDNFKVINNIATKDDLALVKQGEYVRKFSERITHRLGLSPVIHQYGERSSNFDSRVLTLRDNTYLVGWWQNERYFADIRKILLKEFVPKNKATGNNTKWLGLAGSTNSISVHVRRGDYISNKHANVHHGLASIDYYNAAVTYMNTYVEKPYFLVFSDDIKWCKNNLKFGKDTAFVQGNDGPLAYEDLRIMSSCKHNIIANSSFSWWGAWLNANSQKIVIAPRNWYQDEKANRETDIVPANWICM